MHFNQEMRHGTWDGLQSKSALTGTVWVGKALVVLQNVFCPGHRQGFVGDILESLDECSAGSF